MFWMNFFNSAYQLIKFHTYTCSLGKLGAYIPCMIERLMFNPFQTNVPFIYPLKTSENLCFYYAFSGYRNGILGWNGLIQKELSHLTPFCNVSKKVSEAKVRDLVFWLFQEEQKLIKMLQFAWCWKWNLETISLRSPHNIFSDFQGDVEKFLSLVFL